MKQIGRGLAGAAVIAAALLVPVRTGHAAGITNTAQPGWTGPVQLQSSGGLGEPSLAIDSAGRLFATAPSAIGSGHASEVWNSTNGGTSFSGPVTPALGGIVSPPTGGGDTDFAIDSADNVYLTDLWLANSAMWVSTDHGASFPTGNAWGHSNPVDDRPWLAYDKHNNQLWLTYDGGDGIHLAHTAPLTNPNLGLVFAADVIAVPECLIGGSNPCNQPPIRQCVCPPGGIAVDQNTGEVFLSYSRQNGGTLGGGVGITTTTDGITFTNTSIAGTGSTGSAFDTEWNFDPIKTDSSGNVYVSWGERQSDSSVAIRYSHSTDHGVNWAAPVTVSTNSTDAVFPTMDVINPGVVGFAWYGTSQATGNPNSVASTTLWDVDYATTSTGLLAAPTFTTSTAIAAMHNGPIQSSNGTSDRSLLDFFQLVFDHSGAPNIMYTSGSASVATNLFFTKGPVLAAPIQTPEVPAAALLIIAGMGIVGVIFWRRSARRSLQA